MIELQSFEDATADNKIHQWAAILSGREVVAEQPMEALLQIGVCTSLHNPTPNLS